MAPPPGCAISASRPSVLEGGFEAWAAAGPAAGPRRQACRPATPQGRTVWVTRARPKIDRIACPWLIRRFVDPDAVFLFVAPSEVAAVGERFGATPFDIEDIFWSHRGETCTFDTMIEEFGLATEPLLRLAHDRARRRHRAARSCAGSSRACSPPRSACRACMPTIWQQLEAGMLLYDAFYRWCRDATEETHNWPTNKAKA